MAGVSRVSPVSALNANPKIAILFPATVLNKADIAPVPDLTEFPSPVAVSALHGQGIDELRQCLAEVAHALNVDVQVRIPYEAGELVDLFHQRGTVESEAHEPGGTRIQGSLPAELLQRYRDYRVDVA